MNITTLIGLCAASLILISQIPQDIMSILGISTAEMDSKIRLLSSNRRDRTVSGLEGNDDERHEIVNAIEYNVKPTETAAGLYYRQLPGQAEPTLEPYSIGTSAKERIQFQLIRQALYRHYFVREIQRLQYQEHILGIEDEEAVTKNGETLHIRHDPGLDAKSLDYIEEVFISENIGQTLQKKATAIKIADPTDPYPQEAVYEMVLPTSEGNKEVIVKAIVPSKSNGPLDEYAALKLLSSMGIQSAKPLARIFTPNSGLPGFIVMEKLPGVSGRLIFERLSEQGLSEAKIQSLKQDAEEHMQRIADKVRRNVGLDKPWRLKDFMIEFEYDANGEPVKIIRLIPIDFERVRVYDPKYPLDIKI